MYEPQNHDSDGASPAPQLGMSIAPQNYEDTIDLREVIAVFRRRWWLILALLVTGVVVAILYTAAAPRVYQATTSVLVDTASSRSSSSEMPLLNDLTALTKSRSIQTQAEIMKSHPIVMAALKRLPSGDVASVRLDGIQVKPLRDTDIIEITVPSASPEMSAKMADAMAQCYIEQTQQDNRGDIRSALSYLSDQLDTTKPELQRARLDLMAFKERNLTVDLSSEITALIGQHAQWEAAEQDSEAELASSRSELKTRAAAHVSLPGAMNADRAQLATGPAVTAIKNRLTELEGQRVTAVAEYVPASPEVRHIDEQIRAVKAQLSDEAATATTQDLAPLQAKVWAGEAKRQAIIAARAETLARLRQQPTLEYRLAELTSNLQTRQKTYEMLNEKFQELRISEQARTTQTRVVAPAITPSAPILPRRSSNMVLGLMLGLFAGIGVAMVVERLDDRIHSEEEARKAAGVPVLGAVRRYRADESAQLKGDEKRSDLLEAFRTLRTNITLSEIDSHVQVLTISSSRPSEGKTSIACNLATALALDGKRTVLIDGDLRAPSVQHRLNCDSNAGLTHVAVGQLSVEDALQDTETPNLRVMTAGIVPPNPAELLNSASWRRSMDKLRETMDYVIVDTSPITLFTDAQILASMSDATILVVSASETNARHLQQSRRLLDMVGARLLGLVLNKVDRSLSSGYYYYSYYGDDYGGKYSSRYDHRDQSTEGRS